MPEGLEVHGGTDGGVAARHGDEEPRRAAGRLNAAG